MTLLSDDEAVAQGLLIPIGELGIELHACRVDRVANGLWQQLSKDCARDKDSPECLDKSALFELLGTLVAQPQDALADDIVHIHSPLYGLVAAIKRSDNRWVLLSSHDIQTQINDNTMVVEVGDEEPAIPIR